MIGFNKVVVNIGSIKKKMFQMIKNKIILYITAKKDGCRD